MKFVNEQQFLSEPGETAEEFEKRIRKEKIRVTPDTYSMSKAKAGDLFWYNRVSLYDISQGKSNWILYETTSVHPKAGIILAERTKNRQVEEVFWYSSFDELYPAEVTLEIDPRFMEVITYCPHQKINIKFKEKQP